jgi:hypothetical protein
MLGARRQRRTAQAEGPRRREACDNRGVLGATARMGLATALLVVLAAPGCARQRRSASTAATAPPAPWPGGPAPVGPWGPGQATLPGAGVGATAAPAAPPLALPPPDTDEGVMARMLLAECKTPGYADYDEAAAYWAMLAMKAVVHNRLREGPARFGAAGARSTTDIITAPGQWAGFSRSPRGELLLDADVVRHVDELLACANDGAPGPCYRFVRNALAVTYAPAQDPFAGLRWLDGGPVLPGAFGWRREGSPAPGPGGAFVAIPRSNGGVLAGAQFYALRP